jgi:hypothetical protein
MEPAVNAGPRVGDKAVPGNGDVDPAIVVGEYVAALAGVIVELDVRAKACVHRDGAIRGTVVIDGCEELGTTQPLVGKTSSSLNRSCVGPAAIFS